MWMQILTLAAMTMVLTVEIEWIMRARWPIPPPIHLSRP